MSMKAAARSHKAAFSTAWWTIQQISSSVGDACIDEWKTTLASSSDYHKVIKNIYQWKIQISKHIINEIKELDFYFQSKVHLGQIISWHSNSSILLKYRNYKCIPLGIRLNK